MGLLTYITQVLNFTHTLEMWW